MKRELNQQEKTYLQKLRQIISTTKDPVETVDQLAAIDVSNKDGFSLNALNIINYVDDLDFEREDGKLEGGDDGSAFYKGAEQNIAKDILKRVKYVLADIEKDNWYRYTYSVDFVYSRLKDGVYSYRSTTQPINATTKDEAEKQKDELKQIAPRAYAQEPEFTLEDVRVSARLIGSNDKHVN